MKAVWSLLVALCLSLVAGEAPAQISDISAAINKAGRERMLSQRIAKAYFQLGQGIDPERSMKVLYSSISAFDRHLVELKNFAPTAEIKDTYIKLEKSWLAYKDVLIGANPNQAAGKKVLELSEEVLALAHQGAVQLEKHAASNAGRLVNLAGRQRMLSQRMAKYYQAMGWGIADASSSTELEKARKEFAATLQELASAPGNTQQIKDGLDLVKQQWLFFETALGQRHSTDKRYAASVATSSERILEEMEGVVSLYEKAGEKVASR